MLLPLIGAPLILSFLPLWLWKGEAETPRLVHPKAILEESDIEIVADIVASLKPVQRNVLSTWCPANTGDRFWMIWCHAEQFNKGHAV